MAGIYHNAELGVISLSSDGESWITIADKNLGATTVYNYGDTITEDNSGKLFQWGNNYGFPLTGSISTYNSDTNASAYGPGNYYLSSTYLKKEPRDVSKNFNLWGGVTGTNEAMQGPCNTGFHIPTKNEWQSIIDIGTSFGIFVQDYRNAVGTYLKLSAPGYRNEAANIFSGGQYWTTTIASNEDPYFLNITYEVLSAGYTGGWSSARSIRPFKNEVEIPYADEGWTKLYGDDLQPRPVPPPQKIIKRFQNSGNYYYFGDAPTHASGITLNKSSISLTVEGQTDQLIATVTPENAVEKSVTWTSSDTTVAKVYQDGTVECVTPGECTITCTVNDGGYTATCSVNSRVDVYVDFLLVGGGGGGGGTGNCGTTGGGGGGAGGYKLCNNILLEQGSYNITVGNGGSGQYIYTGCNGGYTSIEISGNTIVACGGGGGGTNAYNGCDGGSGGGGGGNDSFTRCGGSGISGQGCSGGNGAVCGGGGGGGPGSAGTTRGATCGGIGGDGKSFTIYGTTYCIGGGGGGGGYCYRGTGSWGGGSGGIGRNGTSPSNGGTYCGAGGGGGACCGGGNGAKGVAIIWYPTSCGYTVTGGTCYTCGDYTIHCFTSDGTLCIN